MNNGDLDMYSTTEFYESIEWKCACEIYGDNGFHIFPDEIKVENIKQGQLDDCYFVTCLATLAASNPEHLKKLFKVQKPNHAGIYVI